MTTQAGAETVRPDLRRGDELHASIAGSLRHASQVWENAKSMRTDMPCIDDFEVSLLDHEAARILVIDVLDQPLRLKIASAGSWIEDCYGESLQGRAADKIQAKAPLDDLWSQCVDAVRCRCPVLYSNYRDGFGYERIALPLWGDSGVEKLAVVIAQLPDDADCENRHAP
jgi:hypothetical protein